MQVFWSSWEFLNFVTFFSSDFSSSLYWQLHFVMLLSGWGSPEVPSDVAWRFDITSVSVLAINSDASLTSLTFEMPQACMVRRS